MPGKLVRTPYDDLTYRIIGSAMAVHRAQGSGKHESDYQRALEAQFAQDGLAFVAEKNIEVYHENPLIGLYIPDFIVEDTLVVEIKALSGLDNSHVAQVIGYLAVTSCPVGLLINFGARSLQWRRILPP